AARGHGRADAAALRRDRRGIRGARGRAAGEASRRDRRRGGARSGIRAHRPAREGIRLARPSRVAQAPHRPDRGTHLSRGLLARRMPSAHLLRVLAREPLDRLRRAGWGVYFATNNSTATRDDYLRRLADLGLGGERDQIVTSAYATAHYLERREPRPNDVFVVGADGLREEIRAVGIH